MEKKKQESVLPKKNCLDNMLMLYVIAETTSIRQDQISECFVVRVIFCANVRCNAEYRNMESPDLLVSYSPPPGGLNILIKVGHGKEDNCMDKQRLILLFTTRHDCLW